MASDEVGKDDNLAGLKGDALIVQEAKERFKRCYTWESTQRERAVDDLKFSLADPDNGWQWEEEMLNSRDIQAKVTLTLNKVRVHCLQIENETRKNKPSINIRPTGNGATYDSSQIFEGICRHIEYISMAQAAYITANQFQVRTGIGYVRVKTDYVGPDTFDQEIYIVRVKDPTTVYLDPDINDIDGLDAKFGFVYDDMPKDEYRRQYPDHLDVASSGALGDGMEQGWIGENHVRVCEYFRKVQKKDWLIRAVDPDTGETIEARRSKLPSDVWERLNATMDKKVREVFAPKIEWYKIAGNTVIDRGDWLGIYVPIARAVGEEYIVEKQLDRKGHVRPMKDAQRQYNFWASAATESIAMQPLQPWLLDPESIEENDSVWSTANIKKHAYLPWKKYDDQGRELPKPERINPAAVPEALMQGMMTSQNEMMMTSGQYQSQMGENENAKSGRAIAERQAQGDTATYHFTDGMGIMVRSVGKMLIDLIPKIYDKPGRIIKIMAEDKSEKEVLIDPTAEQAWLEKKQENSQNAIGILNPTVGTYDVEADTGPDYATRRQEAFNALTQLMAANKELVLIAGDLLMQAADFPMADELAKRLKRMVPPQALGLAPPPQLAQQIAELSKQNASLTNVVQELTKKIAEDAVRVKGLSEQLRTKGEQKDIDVFDAQTRRIKAEGDAVKNMGPQPDIEALINKTIRDSLAGPELGPIIKANVPELADDTSYPDQWAQPNLSPPIPGAQRSHNDGKWYVQHPSGQHYRVDMKNAG
jgi:hypothetical protein